LVHILAIFYGLAHHMLEPSALVVEFLDGFAGLKSIFFVYLLSSSLVLAFCCKDY